MESELLLYMGVKLGLTLRADGVREMVLRKTFQLDGSNRSWRKPHNENLHHLYSSTNITWTIKSQRTRWAGHITHKGEK
jgi:hypothetical protein